MKQDEIIEMAREVGMYGLVEGGLIKEFEAFAKLVATKEREACALICENFADQDSGPDGIWIDYPAHLIRSRGEA